MYEVAEDASITSGVTSVPASGSIVVGSLTIAGGAKWLLASMNARVIDAGSDQITFTVRRNGQSVDSSLEKIPGSFFDYTPGMAVQKELPPGTFDLYATNASGVAIRVVGTLKGFLLRERFDKGRRGSDYPEVSNATRMGETKW